MPDLQPFPTTPAHACGRDDPTGWLGTSDLLDFEDCKLRLKAQALTQLSKTPREKAVAIYGFVKRMALSRPIKMRPRTAREVLEAGSGDAEDKATVFVALLRAAGIPARICYAELRGEILQGLAKIPRAARPLVEVWLDRWVRSDTYIFDAGYMAAARQRLKDSGREWGYGIHVRAHTLWNGVDDAFLGGCPTADDPMVLRELGPFHDPEGLQACPEWRAEHRRMARTLHWNVLAPSIGKVIRELREESGGALGNPRRA